MAVQFYGYNKCGTCVKARKFLEAKKIAFKEYEIINTPPSKALLKKLLREEGISLKDLFNKSGELYRSMNMKEKLPLLSEAEALDLLAGHGKLIKRPIISDGKRHTVGFKEDVFNKVWRKP